MTDPAEFQWQPYLDYAQVFHACVDLPTLRSWSKIAQADLGVNERTRAVLKRVVVRNVRRIEACKP